MALNEQMGGILLFILECVYHATELCTPILFSALFITFVLYSICIFIFYTCMHWEGDAFNLILLSVVTIKGIIF